MSSRRPAPEHRPAHAGRGRRDPRLGRLDPVVQGRRQDLRAHRLAARVGVVAGVLLGGVVATTAPGLLPVALAAALAWPAMARIARRRAAARRLAIRRDAAPAVLDLLGAALLAPLVGYLLGSVPVARAAILSPRAWIVSARGPTKRSPGAPSAPPRTSRSAP